MNPEEEVVGYVVVDAQTKAIDWDGEMHPTIDSAIESLTGPRQMYCKTLGEEAEEKTHWGRHYLICPVTHRSQP